MNIMNISEIDEIKVVGLSVRTNNSSEMDPSTAKIGSLWEKFYAEIAPGLNQKSRVFGLYTNYDADHTGKFDVVACSDYLNIENTQELKKYTIIPGKYVIFKAKGEMPTVVVELWEQVWTYFSSESCQYRRAFTTDFELYRSENEIEIYISV